MSNYIYEENDKMKEDLYKKVIEFMQGNRISCEETIYQCDWVIENAYGFIEDLFKIVEHKLSKTTYDD